MHDPLLELSIRFSMGEILSDDLSKAATALVETGWTSQSMCAVAGLSAAERAEAQELFARGLSELGVSLSLHEACMLRAESYAEAIVAGVFPEERASDLYYLDRHMGPLAELNEFLMAYARGAPREQRADPVEVRSVEAGVARRLLEVLAGVAVPQRKRAAQQRVAAGGPGGYAPGDRS